MSSPLWTRQRAATVEQNDRPIGTTPMANAFRRLGYVDFERSINMTWPE